MQPRLGKTKGEFSHRIKFAQVCVGTPMNMEGFVTIRFLLLPNPLRGVHANRYKPNMSVCIPYMHTPILCRIVSPWIWASVERFDITGWCWAKHLRTRKYPNLLVLRVYTRPTCTCPTAFAILILLSRLHPLATRCWFYRLTRNYRKFRREYTTAGMPDSYTIPSGKTHVSCSWRCRLNFAYWLFSFANAELIFFNLLYYTPA